MYRVFISKLTARFYADDCYGKAASLSFYTLLSIVPLLAIAFGIAKGFGFEQLLEKEILETFSQQKEMAGKIVSWAKNALENAHGSLIAGIGVILLFWSALGLVGQLETALNYIWRVPFSRSLTKKLVDYLPLLIFGPIFLISTSSLSFFIISQIVKISVALGLYSHFLPVIYAIYYVLLLFIAWIFFSFVYLYLPNQKLPWKPNVLAALSAGFAFQLVQIGYIHFQLFLTNYNTIYGSFAAVPLFLLWIQISWLITLAGAEIAAFMASTDWTLKEKNMVTENELCLLLLSFCSKKAATLEEVSQGLSLSPYLAEKGLNKCLAAGILSFSEKRFKPDSSPIPLEISLKRLQKVDEGYYFLGLRG